MNSSFNNLESVPPLPNSRFHLNCALNQLTYLPSLPSKLQYLECYHNNISCFPLFPISLTTLYIFSNPFTCLPKHIAAMDAATLAYPICMNGDEINNPNHCLQVVSIKENELNENMNIYPNPSNGIYFITFKDGINIANTQITVENLLGKEIFKSPIEKSVNEIDLSHQANGVYLVKISGANFTIHRQIIKQ